MWSCDLSQINNANVNLQIRGCLGKDVMCTYVGEGVGMHPIEKLLHAASIKLTQGSFK